MCKLGIYKSLIQLVAVVISVLCFGWVLRDISLIYILSGEFTLRAFLSGRLDLSQAENVGKLISSKSMAAADAALSGIQVCPFSAAHTYVLQF